MEDKNVKFTTDSLTGKVTREEADWTPEELAKQAYVDPQEYARKRKAEYPPHEDYLDGVVKGDNAQITKYIDDCKAVKLKYPK
jgi:hypothetical protein